MAAVDGISFDVAAGEIFGLLGPNGAGKTTTLESILGLIAPDAGRIEIASIDVRAEPRSARAKTGAVLQATGLQDKITPREALGSVCRFLSGALEDRTTCSNASGWRKKRMLHFDTLSGGQKQRLALALAFVGNPQACWCWTNRPTGLDPQMRREVQDHIRGDERWRSRRAAGHP